MEKFKNFIYDKNDIVIALVIIVLATFIITGRINAIMAYPETMLAQAQEQGVGTTDPAAPGADPAAPEATEPNPPAVTDPAPPVVITPPVVAPPVVTPPVTNPPAAGQTVTITIPSGSTGNAIAGILITNGLITQKSDFFSALTAAAAETKLKAGTFKIPTGSTPAQIVAIIAK